MRVLEQGHGDQRLIFHEREHVRQWIRAFDPERGVRHEGKRQGTVGGVAMQGKLEHSRFQINMRISITVLVFYHYLTS